MRAASIRRPPSTPRSRRRLRRPIRRVMWQASKTLIVIVLLLRWSTTAVQAAVVFRAESHDIAGSGANANPGEPAGAAQGDILVGMLVTDAASATCALPSGWTTLYSGTVTGNVKFAVGYIARGA